ARPQGKARAGVGTRQYLSPEQARGGVLGPPADVWGIGAVLYATATGRRPFYGLDQDTSYPQLDERAAPVAAHRRLPAALSSARAPDLGRGAADSQTTAELRADAERCG